MARARRRRMVREIAVPPTDHPAHSRDRDSEIDLKNARDAEPGRPCAARTALRRWLRLEWSWLVQRAYHLPARGPGWPAFSTRCEGNLAMPESITFEDRIAEQPRLYAAPAARPPRRGRQTRSKRHGNADGVQRRSWWPAWRSNSLNTYVKLIAAAAVLVVAVAGYQFLPAQSGGSGQPPIAPSPSPSAAQTAGVALPIFPAFRETPSQSLPGHTPWVLEVSRLDQLRRACRVAVVRQQCGASVPPTGWVKSTSSSSPTSSPIPASQRHL